MAYEKTIQDLIRDKIQILNLLDIQFLDSSYLKKISEIDIDEKQLGRIIFGLLKTHREQLTSLKTYNCTQYFHLSLCYMDCSNLPQETNGITPLAFTEKLNLTANQVSPFQLREFEGVALHRLSPGVKELHLRIPLISPPRANLLLNFANDIGA